MKAAKGSIKKVHVLRLEPSEDVLESITKYCDDNGVQGGVILSGIGSLDGCSFLDPEEISGKPGSYGYGEAIDIPSPIELVGLNGIICKSPEGGVLPHIHACFADKKGNEYGGHLKEGNKVLITVELAIAELEGIAMNRAVDPSKGVPVLSPEEC